MIQDDGSMRPISRAQAINEKIKGNGDLIFRVGERVKIKGAWFRVTSLGRKRMIVHGCKGTIISDRARKGAQS